MDRYRKPIRVLPIAQLPKMRANPLVEQGLLQPLLNERFQSSSPIYAVYHDRQFQPQKVRVLLSAMEQNMQKTIEALESDIIHPGYASGGSQN